MKKPFITRFRSPQRGTERDLEITRRFNRADYSSYTIHVTGELSFSKFLASLPEDDPVRKKLDKMLDKLKSNPDAGDQIQRGLWPDDYKKAGFRNIFRYEVDDSMRATYTIRHIGSLHIEVAVIEFFRTHKEYERKFRY